MWDRYVKQWLWESINKATSNPIRDLKGLSAQAIAARAADKGFVRKNFNPLDLETERRVRAKTRTDEISNLTQVDARVFTEGGTLANIEEGLVRNHDFGSLDINKFIQKNIENERGNLTRFLVMGKNISQPEFGENKYITSFLFKLKSKPAALYQSLGGFAINGVNLTKLQSYPEKNTFDSFFFLCDLDGHIEDPKVQKSLEELGLHCEDFHVLGVFEADKLREKKN